MGGFGIPVVSAIGTQWGRAKDNGATWVWLAARVMGILGWGLKWVLRKGWHLGDGEH